jgi:hypothetical protein
VADTVTNLLWHAGHALGADLLARLDLPAPRRHAPRETLPPALLEYAVRRGDAHATVGSFRARTRSTDPAGDEDLLLRLLERDDPEVNETLFRHCSWPALRRAVMSQHRFARDPDPDLAGTPLPLTDALREQILARATRADLQAALFAVDPDLVFWALVSGVPGGAHGGRLARLRACATLAAAGRRAQLRHVLQTTPVELPPDAPAQLADELRGARAHDRLPKILEAEYGPGAVAGKLRGVKQVAHARSVIRDALEPPWPELLAEHRADPFPWGAAVALLEHARCPRALQAALLRTHPRAVQSVTRPGPEVFAVCQELGEDQLTKKVLLRAIATDTIDAGQLVAEVRPARIALTALVHGDLHAVATQARAIGMVRQLACDRLAADPDAWRGWYAALPHFTGTAAQLIAAADPAARPDTPRVPRQATDGDSGTDTPRLGRQSAWAYNTLIDVVGAEHAARALGFLDDAGLAPLAGARGVPQAVADHIAAHGGPVARRVLAGNADLRPDLLEALVLGGDRAIASAAYRHPRCPMPLRQYILSVDGIDADLRAELLTERRLHELWPLLASPDAALLRHVALAAERDLGRWTRLRAAYRLAELHGLDALTGLPDQEVALAHRHGRLGVLGDMLRRIDSVWPKALTEARYLPRQSDPYGVHGALADPGLDWRPVLSHARRGNLSEVVLGALADRPDCPMELARILRDRGKGQEADRRWVWAQGVLRHRAVAAELLDEKPLRWNAPDAVVTSGVLTPEEFVAGGEAAQVVDVSLDRVPVARAVARLLHDTLGDAVDAWVVFARLLDQRPPATLAELASTAQAAA